MWGQDPVTDGDTGAQRGPAATPGPGSSPGGPRGLSFSKPSDSEGWAGVGTSMEPAQGGEEGRLERRVMGTSYLSGPRLDTFGYINSLTCPNNPAKSILCSPYGRGNGGSENLLQATG